MKASFSLQMSIILIYNIKSIMIQYPENRIAHVIVNNTTQTNKEIDSST